MPGEEPPACVGEQKDVGQHARAVILPTGDSVPLFCVLLSGSGSLSCDRYMFSGHWVTCAHRAESPGLLPISGKLEKSKIGQVCLIFLPFSLPCAFCLPASPHAHAALSIAWVSRHLSLFAEFFCYTWHLAIYTKEISSRWLPSMTISTIHT